MTTDGTKVYLLSVCIVHMGGGGVVGEEGVPIVLPVYHLFLTGMTRTSFAYLWKVPYDIRQV